MRKPLLLLTVFIIAAQANVFCQEPVEYPGAVMRIPGNNRQYLSHDSYEKIKEFYVGVYGEPDNVNKQDLAERYATFFWEETIYEPRAVHVLHRQGDSKAVKNVFSKLKGLIEMDILDENRYYEIEKKYIHLVNYYYLLDKDEDVYKKYNKKLGAGGTEAVNNKEIMAEAQKLLMAGKVQEGMAMMEDMKKEITDSIEHAKSPAAIDSWIECLEEISLLKYPIMIMIGR